MKINLIVRQINQKADVIKQYMGEAWKKLETIEQIYQNTMMQVFCGCLDDICQQVTISDSFLLKKVLRQKIIYNPSNI